jgi:hypothetical protein
MRVRNETRYSTIELRKHLLAVMKKVGVTPKNYVIIIQYRRGGVAGYGRYGAKWIKILMLREKQNMTSFCKVVEHEIMHNLDVHHKDMDDSAIYQSWKHLESEWLYEQAPKEKPKVNKVEQRHDHAKRMFKKWETRLKRTTSVYKKWKRKLAYYEAKNHKT